MSTHRAAYLIAAVLAVACLLASCAKGPEPVRPGTPAFYWAGAETAYKSGDYVKTSETLAQLTGTDNEYVARARPWLVVVASGLSQGYSDVANSYESGGKMVRGDREPFRKATREARVAASQCAMLFAETVHRFVNTNKDATVALGFGYPAGEITEPAPLAKLSKGLFIQGAEADTLLKAMLKRGIVRASCRVVGVDKEKDADKAAEIFKKGAVPRDDFMIGAAGMLYDLADLFGPKKEDMPQRAKALCTEANDALAAVPPTKKTKDLQAKIAKTLKKLGA